LSSQIPIALVGQIDGGDRGGSVYARRVHSPSAVTVPLRLSSLLIDLRPQASAELAEAHVRACAVAGEATPQIASTVRRMLGIERSPAGAEQGGAIIDFVEQFVLDVGSMPMELVDALASAINQADVAEFVRAIYVIEYAVRLEALSATLLGGQSRQPPAHQAADDDGTIRAALNTFQSTVLRGTDLDAATTELVRLRCARTHHCRICSTLRLGAARHAGVDDEVTAKIDRYETSDLAERAKIALRITDAFILRPDLLAAQTVTDAHSHFRADELAELLLDITKWSTQKINVALGTDGAERLPVNDDGVAFFDIDDHGRLTGFSATAGPVTQR